MNKSKQILWKYNIGDIFIDNKRHIQLIDKEVRICEYNHKTRKNIIVKKSKNVKWYKYKCFKCSWDNGWIREEDITKGVGCSCCKGRTVVKGINDFGTKYPEKLKYFVNIEDAFSHTTTSGKIAQLRCPHCGKIKQIMYRNFDKYGFNCNNCNSIYNVRNDLVRYFDNIDDAKNYTIGSHEIVNMHCPICNYKKKMEIHNFCTDGFCCPKCSDGISYPEKFVMEVLEQLGLKYSFQFSRAKCDWCKNYRYDFYLDDFNYIIEVHGIQHYEEKNGFANEGLEAIKLNDKKKKELALENGIKAYIEIPAKRSRLEYLKQSVVTSLGEYFNLNNINWIKCGQEATQSIVKDVCDYYESKIDKNGIIDDMCNHFNICDTTLRNYLHRGNENNWCKYTPGEMSRKK